MEEVYEVDGAAVAVVVEITQMVVGDAAATVRGAGTGKYDVGGVRVGIGGGSLFLLLLLSVGLLPLAFFPPSLFGLPSPPPPSLGFESTPPPLPSPPRLFALNGVFLLPLLLRIDSASAPLLISPKEP
jgi:hypothetical protein